MKLIRRLGAPTPALVSDWGDDYEMSEESGNSLMRAGDRMLGFAAGVSIITVAWAMWLLM